MKKADIPKKVKKARVIPGYRCTLGIVVTMLSLIVLIPLASVLVHSLQISPREFFALLWKPNVRNAFLTSIGCSFVAAVLNAVFGLIVAWTLVKYDFPGKRILDGFIELPFALPTAVAGITLSKLYSESGWLGSGLEKLGIKVTYTHLGLVIALIFVGLPFVIRAIRLSLIIGLVTIVLGYPVAYLMNRVGPVLRCIIMGCVQIPFWTSLLVRTYSWIAILQNQGVVNVVLQKLGIIKQPIQLLYNDAGVIIVMTYIMLPYMIFSISSVMGQIDKNVIIASRSLGAGKTMTFFRIFLPLSLPGIMSGFFIVFLNTMGYYIVPALVGGQKSQMFSQTIQNELSGVLNWNFASAISIILVMVTMMIVLASKAATKQKYAEV